MMVKEIKINAVAQGQKGEFTIGVNADVDRRICLDLMVEAVMAIPEVSVIVPIHIVDMNGNVRPVDVDATTKALQDNNIKIEGDRKMEDKNFEDFMKQAFTAVEEQLDKAAQTIVKKGGQSHIARIMNTPDSKVYSEMLTSLENIKNVAIDKAVKSSKGIFGAKKPNNNLVAEVAEVIEVQDSLKASVDKVIEEATDKVTVMARIKALAVLVFKKVVALLKGVVSFTFDTTTILGTAVGRITYHTARELVFAGKAIGQAFNKDIIQAVKKA